MQTISAMIVTKEQTSFTELLDNVEGIILDLDNLHYYTLNSTGLFIWKQLRSGASRTQDHLAEEMTRAFGLPQVVIERDLQAFLGELEGNGLITRSYDGVVDRAVRTEESGTGLQSYEAPRLNLSNSLTQVTLSGSSTIATAAIATG